MKIHKRIKIIMAVWAISMLTSCADNAQLSAGNELAKKLAQDERLQTVAQKAETLLRQGLNAGDGYGEVWIRDLNTFVELACKAGDTSQIREALLVFFKFQGADGNIPDGYIPKDKAGAGYEYGYTALAPEFASHKNTVETDQETSLIQAVAKYIQATGDDTILEEMIGDKTIRTRLYMALQYLLDDRYSDRYGLLWGATTVDWGDVQPEQEWGVRLDDSSHRSIDIYDNAMFLIAIRDLLNMTRASAGTPEKTIPGVAAAGTQQKTASGGVDTASGTWEKIAQAIADSTRKHLWDETKQKFIPHIYLEGSPFPADFDENAIHYHGGTAIAIEAGLLNSSEIKTVYRQMQENVEAAGAQSIGLTIYPVYPDGFFKNPSMGEYSYQNGGDWTWFGGRMVQQLILNGFEEEAYEAIAPMLDRVIQNDGFFEWYTRDGKPSGSGKFRGSAGVLWKAIQLFTSNPDVVTALSSDS